MLLTSLLIQKSACTAYHTTLLLFDSRLNFTIFSMDKVPAVPKRAFENSRSMFCLHLCDYFANTKKWIAKWFNFSPWIWEQHPSKKRFWLLFRIHHRKWGSRFHRCSRGLKQHLLGLPYFIDQLKPPTRAWAKLEHQHQEKSWDLCSTGPRDTFQPGALHYCWLLFRALLASRT